MNSKKTIAITAFIFIILALFNLSQKANYLFAYSLEEELQDIKEEREETQKKIEEAKEIEKQYINEVSLVEDKLLESLSELYGLNEILSESKSRVDETTIELVIKEEELVLIEAELLQMVQILNDRAAALYKSGNNNILELLLNSKDFIEFMSQLKLINLLIEKDSESISQLKEKKNAALDIKNLIIDLREEQKANKAEVELLLEKAEDKTTEIEHLYSEKEDLLSQTTANIDALVNLEKELEIEEAELNIILESYKYGSAPSGYFTWPVAGQLTSGFGYRIHPILGINKFHSGIDLAASYGTLIKAADGGQVIQAGYSGGYGYSVTLYHGGGFATLYAHLSSIQVAIGQNIESGQVLGLVGSTGLSTGPHLHFEVRINGEPQDPLEYLP